MRSRRANAGPPRTPSPSMNALRECSRLLRSARSSTLGSGRSILRRRRDQMASLSPTPRSKRTSARSVPVLPTFGVKFDVPPRNGNVTQVTSTTDSAHGRRRRNGTRRRFGEPFRRPKSGEDYAARYCSLRTSTYQMKFHSQLGGVPPKAGPQRLETDLNHS